MELKYLVHIYFVISLIGIGILGLFIGLNEKKLTGKKEISTKDAPAAIGPYSQAIFAGNYLFVSGQIAIPPDGAINNNDTAAGQARQALANIRAILEEANLDFSNVVKATVLFKDLSDFGEVNKVYEEFFPSPYPARAAFEVSALPKDAKVEIEVIAIKD